MLSSNTTTITATTEAATMEVESLDPDHPKAKYCLMGAKAQEQDLDKGV